MHSLRLLRWSIFLVAFPFGILGFVLPIYGLEAGANAVKIGLFFTVFSLMLVVMRPVVGLGLDRVGRRPFLFVGIAGYAVAMFAFAFATEVRSILVAQGADAEQGDSLALSSHPQRVVVHRVIVQVK